MDLLVERALIESGRAAFRAAGRHLYQFIAAPVQAPDTIAWLLMGFAADDELARKIGGVAGVDASFVAVDGAGAQRRHDARSRAAVHPRRLAGRQRGHDPAGRMEKEFLAHVVTLEPGADAVRLVLLKPARDVLAPYAALRNTMFLVSGTALLLAMAVGMLLGRGATRPIGQLVSAAKRIEDGQYDAPVAVEGGEEFRRLAGTLNAMQDRVAEREARIRQQAYHDELTGLPNRARAEIELGRMLAGPAARPRDGDRHPPHQPPGAECVAGTRDRGRSSSPDREKSLIACRPGECVARLGASRYLMLVNRRLPPSQRRALPP